MTTPADPEPFEMRVEEPAGSGKLNGAPPNKREASLAFLQANPGQWCAIGSGKLSAMWGRVSSWQKRPDFTGCEFRVRKNGKAHTLYGIYHKPEEQ